MPVESIQDDNQKFLNFFALWCEAISARRMRARKEQQAEKEVVPAEVRAMKKSADKIGSSRSFISPVS